MTLERNIYKKRAIFGYDPKEIREHLRLMQHEHQLNIKKLEEKLLNEKEKNHKLKRELEIENLMLSQINPLAQNINEKLFEAFKLQTEQILNLKIELEAEEKRLLEILDKKLEEKNLAKASVEKSLHYLKSLRNQHFHIEKELGR
ncbi:MAG: hypothetical protein Q8934_10320 [Bacillota bacterium]|nr:hypothetical protein [Bacillota bacterium]